MPKRNKKMNVTFEQIINDLINKPGLGMFIWFCLLSFFVALIFFIWALKSGQLTDLEESKFEMLEDNPKKEVHNNG